MNTTKFCAGHTAEPGRTIALIAIPLYVLALVLNMLNFIYLRFITNDRKRLPTYVSYYSLNMIVLKPGLIVYIMDMLQNDFYMGNYACKYMYVSLELGNYITALLVMCICLDQYQFVFHSSTYSRKFTSPSIIHASVCGVAGAFVTPWVYLFHVQYFKCGNRYCSATASTLYDIALASKLMLFFVFPCFIMLFLYIKILHYLHTKEIALNTSKKKLSRSDNSTDSSNDGNNEHNDSKNNVDVVTINFETEKSHSKIKYYQKTMIHMTIIFGLFFMSALPYFVLRGLRDTLKLSRMFLKCFYILWALGHSYHPLMYTLANKQMMEDINKRIKKLFKIS